MLFTFDGKDFKQKFGVAMGLPLSPVLANLCMEFTEYEYISSCPGIIKPLVWLRYVDNNFIIYQKDQACFGGFLNFASNLVPSIRYTT